MPKAADWAKARAEYHAGASLASITRKHGITMRELFKRIKDEGWTRRGDKPAPSKAVALHDPERVEERVDAALDEAIADILAGHKSISRQLREELDSEIAEYQRLKGFLLSSMDENAIDQLVRQVEPGKPNYPLIEFLERCMVTFSKRVGSIDKLASLGMRIIDTERRVWGLDKDGGETGTESYDDLLEQCSKALDARHLPPGVADFEEKLAQRTQVRKRTTSSN